MPVIINEVIIRATVDDSARPADNGRRSSSGRGRLSSANSSVNKQELVRTCVEQVMAALERKKRR